MRLCSQPRQGAAPSQSGYSDRLLGISMHSIMAQPLWQPAFQGSALGLAAGADAAVPAVVPVQALAMPGAWLSWPTSLSSRPYNAAATQRQRGIRVVWAYPRLVLWSRLADPSGERPPWMEPARGQARRMPNPPALDRHEDLWTSKGRTVGKRVWRPRCRTAEGIQRALPSGQPNHRPPRRCWEGDDGVAKERAVCQRQEHAVCASPPLGLRPGAALRTRNAELRTSPCVTRLI